MKYLTADRKFAPRRIQYATGGVLALLASGLASAADIESIGTSVATEIAKFAIMISAIGTAVLAIVILIQGFKMAFRMTNLAK